MSSTPIIITSVAAFILLVGGTVLYNRENSYWSDGSRKIYRDIAEANILDWRKQSLNATASKLSEWRFRKGGKRKKYTRKHYK